MHVDGEVFNNIWLRRSVFEFMQACMPREAIAIVVPLGTDFYELTGDQIRRMYEAMVDSGIKGNERMLFDIAREGAEQCPVCRGAGVITVVHPANDVPPTDGC